jgi:gamma-glutamyl:cysteine ligase YbdK (ATP-grasp superfamily)
VPLHLFEAVGVELEYMIVDARTLSIAPIADSLIEAAGGSVDSDPEFGPVTWSNELTRHLVELKTTEPARSLAPVAAQFQENVARANTLLAPHGARLMPGPMHPWMHPSEMRLWPHGNREIYAAFDRIFGCHGHGWANLQSMHINLPFSGDEEFARLHAAIRLVLPILPALAAGSPFMESAATGLLDTRLEVYRHNSRNVPSMAGQVIPEPVYTEADYRARIFERIWGDLAPHDPQGILRDEWANSRGCIARFGRGSIEIRVIDVQECPAADLAICAAVVSLVRHLAVRPEAQQPALRAWPVDRLAPIFLACVKDADNAVITDREYLGVFGLDAARATSGDLWRHLLAEGHLGAPSPELRVILQHGCLARRLLHSVGAAGAGPVPADRLHSLAERLCDCLARGRQLVP